MVLKLGSYSSPLYQKVVFGVVPSFYINQKLNKKLFYVCYALKKHVFLFLNLFKKGRTRGRGGEVGASSHSLPLSYWLRACLGLFLNIKVNILTHVNEKIKRRNKDIKIIKKSNQIITTFFSDNNRQIICFASFRLERYNLRST